MMKKLLLVFGALCSVLVAQSQGVEVSIEESGGTFELYRDGSPYYVNGAAFSGHFLDSLSVYGGNSIRTYSTDSSTIDLLNKADSLGITVTMGLYAGREEDFFNYNDTAAVSAQLEDFRNYVRMYRDHPAVLMWSIGNEADASYTNYRLWDAVNDIAAMIHEEDTLHPTMTVLASAHDVDIIEIKARAPEIDVLGINVYKTLDNLENQLTTNGWTKPYIVTEWGVDGTWQTDETAWNAPIELSSTSKAYIYRTRYSSYIAANPMGQCLGSYVFVWGHQNHGEVESWYSLFTVNGESTEVVEAMQYSWTGSYPAERAPRITQMVLNGQEEGDNVRLSVGSMNWATVDAYDPNGDGLSYEWYVVKEGYDLDDATSGESLPGLDGLITYQSDDSIAFSAPSAKGAYRLYAVVLDGNSKVALMNIPFQVQYATNLLMDYEGTGALLLDSSVGTYSVIANPYQETGNFTDSVGRYVAPGSDPYDKFTFSSGVAVEDAGKFKNGDFKVRMELYTDAPIGTPLQLNFHNAAAAAGSYPAGRNSVYKTTVPAQNEWRSITFDFYNIPDPSIGDHLVDQLVFAFDAGTSSSYTYYFDNIRIEKESEDKLSSDIVFENYETTSVISQLSASGSYSVVANEWIESVNKTDSTSMYIRNSGATYDGLTFVNEAIEDASEYESEAKAFAINLRTAAPVGTLMQIQLRNDSMLGSSPAGRHSIYEARTLKQSEWHRVIFNHVSSPDASVPDNLVDRMVFLMSPGIATADTFYIDNIRTIGVNVSVPSLPDPWDNTDIGSVGLAGSTVDKYSGQVFVIQGSGSNIWGSADEFQYAYQPFSGDGEIISMIPSISPDVDDYMKAGLMFREALDADSKHAMVYITPENGNAYQTRQSTGGTCVKSSDATSIDRWLKLKRSGDLFEAYQSNDGNTWALIDSSTVVMSSDLYVGLAVTAHDNTKKGKATFRDISISSASGARLTTTWKPVESPKLSIYPNPVENHLHVTVDGGVDYLDVFTLQGERVPVSQQTSQGMTQIDMSHLKSGVYLLRLSVSGKYYNRMVIKR
ncbi:T9SS type A sorting domain-containing protein [Marinoscillum sp.]|uniref:T9SS type A sorting domain-containing protein n=1 Tax=Marinoscillum sp. TaxID=2024838 RepID=UPI003BA9D09E